MNKTMLFVLVVAASVLLAQDKRRKEATPVQGCVSRFNGDFILVKQDPAMTYELQATGKIKLGHYVGQRVEVTGEKSPSLSTSSDFLGSGGGPSPVTLTVNSIKTVSKDCTEHPVSDK